MDLNTALRDSIVADISGDSPRGVAGSDLLQPPIRFNSTKWSFPFLPDAAYRLFAIAEARERVCSATFQVININLLLVI